MLYLLMLLGVLTGGTITYHFFWQAKWYDILIFLGLSILCFALWTAAHFLILWAITWFIKLDEPEEKPNKFFYFMLVETEKIVMFYCKVHLHFEGRELLPENQGFLLIGNHMSGFDPVLCTVVMPEKQLSFVSKPENFRIILAGKMMHKCCYLPVDRENVKNALVTINKAAEYVQKGVVSMGIFPEGTRNRSKDKLLEFRNGAFKIATKAKAPIVVVTIKNAEKIAKHWLWRRTDVYIKVVAVIPAEEVAIMKTAELSEKVRAIMEENL